MGPHKICKHARDSPEVNVLWGMVLGAQKTVTANIYLDMLQLFAFPEEGGGGTRRFFSPPRS